MTVFEIDKLLGQTPCVCGCVATWHPEHYQGKTQEQISAAYRRVYARIRRTLFKRRQDALADVLRDMRSERPAEINSDGKKLLK